MRVFLLLLPLLLFSSPAWSCQKGVEAIGRVVSNAQDGAQSSRTTAAAAQRFDAGDIFKSADRIEDIPLDAQVMVKRGGDKGWVRGKYMGRDGNGRLLVDFTENGVGKTKPVLPENFQTNLKVLDESQPFYQPGRPVLVSRTGGGSSYGTITKYDDAGRARVDFFDESSGQWRHKFLEPEIIGDWVAPVTRQPNLVLKTGESIDVYSRTNGGYATGVITGIDDTGKVNVMFKLDDGRNATKSIPPKDVDTYIRPPKIAQEQGIFRGSPSHSQGKDGLFMAGRRLPNGESRRMMYTVGDREYAIANKKLFEGVKSVHDLPHGNSYTYVVKEDGSMVFGLAEDGWEFGVKHAHLANGDRIVAAGEVTVRGPKDFTWNLESGSFTRKLVESGKTSMDQLKGQMEKLFQSKWGSSGQYTDDILLRSDPPTPDNLRKLCASDLFRALNGGICKDLGI